jgi:AcrR family transcriptional regulator
MDVLVAAARAFDKVAPDAVTLEKLADESGYSRRTIYNYFGSRAGVLTALATTAVDVVASNLSTLATGRSSHELPVLIAAVVAKEGVRDLVRVGLRLRYPRWIRDASLPARRLCRSALSRGSPPPEPANEDTVESLLDGVARLLSSEPFGQ